MLRKSRFRKKKWVSCKKTCTSTETNPFCVNEIDNTQEKELKSWRGIEKYDLENFALV